MPKRFQPAGVGMTPCKTELGSFIRARRLELDLRQVPLAKSAGLAQTYVSQLETGEKKYLDDHQLETLARALACDPEELRKRMPKKLIAGPKAELGRLIRSRREELGLTMEEFAEKAGLTLKQAKILELRKNPGLHHKLVKPLAHALGLEPSILTKFVGLNRKPTNNELGRLIRTRRQELVMSGDQLAEKLGVSRQRVSQIELGQCRLCKDDDMIERLAKVLILEVDQLQAFRLKRRLKRTVAVPATLGRFLADKRLELQLTQREVAERAATSTSVVSALETGRIRRSSKLFNRIAQVLDCQIPPELIPPSRERKTSRPTKERGTARQSSLKD